MWTFLSRHGLRRRVCISESSLTCLLLSRPQGHHEYAMMQLLFVTVASVGKHVYVMMQLLFGTLESAETLSVCCGVEQVMLYADDYKACYHIAVTQDMLIL